MEWCIMEINMVRKQIDSSELHSTTANISGMLTLSLAFIVVATRASCLAVCQNNVWQCSYTVLMGLTVIPRNRQIVFCNGLWPNFTIQKTALAIRWSWVHRSPTLETNLVTNSKCCVSNQEKYIIKFIICIRISTMRSLHISSRCFNTTMEVLSTVNLLLDLSSALLGCFTQTRF